MANPPLMQLALTVSFRNPLSALSIIDIADLYSVFRDDFPIFRQAFRASAMSVDPFDASSDDNFVAPRVLFGTSDARRQVAFQNDRLTVIWMRTTPLDVEPHYPGFPAVVHFFRDSLERLHRWTRDRELPDFLPAICEVSYVDAFALEPSTDASPKRISDFLNTVNPDIRFKVVQFDHKWVEPLENGLDGFTRIEATAPVQLSSGVRIVNLDTTVVIDAGSSWETAEGRFETAHAVALEVFKRVVNPNALAI